MSIQQIAQQFCQAYYATMQSNKNQLIQFFTQNSQMTFNSTVSSGLNEIKDQIESFSFQRISIQVEQMEAQSSFQGCICILVLGQLQMDNDPIMKFSQVFLLGPNGQGGYYCHNDIFKILM